MYCRDCGQILSNDSLRCTNCGTKKGLADNYCYRCGLRIKNHNIYLVKKNCVKDKHNSFYEIIINF